MQRGPYRGIKITIGEVIHQDSWLQISSVKREEKTRAGDANFREYIFEMVPFYPITPFDPQEFLSSLQKGSFYFRQRKDMTVDFINQDGTSDQNAKSHIKNVDWYSLKVEHGSIFLRIGVSILTNVSSINDYFSIRLLINGKPFEEGFNITPLEGRWYKQRLGALNNVVLRDDNTFSDGISTAGHLSGITVSGNLYTHINFDPRNLEYRLVETIKPDVRKHIKIVAFLGKTNLATSVRSTIKVHVAYAPEDRQLNKVVSILLEEVFSS